MNKPTKWFLLIMVVATVGTAAWYYTLIEQPPAPVTDVVVPQSSSSASAAVPPVQYPLSGAVQSAPLPNVDDSDEAIKTSLQNLFDPFDLAGELVATQIVRHIVTTVDNLPRHKLAVPMRMLRATPGQFVVAGTEDDRVISDANYARYARVVNLVRIANVAQLANWYRGHYSLFQQAYQGLGYPQGYFNDRLVQAIDDLLATPEPAMPIHLTQPKVFFEFSDPDLESCSVGQKTLLRMGPYNTRLVKDKLRELRIAITKPPQ